MKSWFEATSLKYSNSEKQLQIQPIEQLFTSCVIFPKTYSVVLPTYLACLHPSSCVVLLKETLHRSKLKTMSKEGKKPMALLLYVQIVNK